MPCFSGTSIPACAIKTDYLIALEDTLVTLLIIQLIAAADVDTTIPSSSACCIALV